MNLIQAIENEKIERARLEKKIYASEKQLKRHQNRYNPFSKSPGRKPPLLCQPKKLRFTRQLVRCENRMRHFNAELERLEFNKQRTEEAMKRVNKDNPLQAISV